MDRVICTYYDGRNNCMQKLTTRDIIENQLLMLRAIYADYFIHDPHPSYKEFVRFCVESVKKMAFAIDDRYADHVEGLRKYIIKQKGKHA